MALANVRYSYHTLFVALSICIFYTETFLYLFMKFYLQVKYRMTGIKILFYILKKLHIIGSIVTICTYFKIQSLKVYVRI